MMFNRTSLFVVAALLLSACVPVEINESPVSPHSGISLLTYYAPTIITDHFESRWKSPFEKKRIVSWSDAVR